MLIVLKCPSCGADLQVNIELRQIVCGYCGNRIIINEHQEDPVKAGFDFERGRMYAQSTVNYDLVHRVGPLIQPLTNVENLEREADRTERRIRELQTACEENRPKAVGWSVFFILAGLLLALLRGPDSAFHPARLLLIPAGIGIAYFVSRSYLADQAELRRTLERYQHLTRAINETLSGINQEDLKLIPREYWQQDALSYIHRALINMRALSMHEAITLYEEHKYRKSREPKRPGQTGFYQEYSRRPEWQRNG